MASLSAARRQENCYQCSRAGAVKHLVPWFRMLRHLETVSSKKSDGAFDICVFFYPKYVVPFFCLTDMSRNTCAVQRNQAGFRFSVIDKRMAYTTKNRDPLHAGTPLSELSSTLRGAAELFRIVHERYVAELPALTANEIQPLFS
jgi:hypothetical protein